MRKLRDVLSGFEMKKIVLITLLFFTACASSEDDSSTNDTTRYNCFVEGIIELANNEVIRKQTLRYNKSPARPKDIDKKWHNLDSDSPTLSAILKNPASKQIWKYIQTYSIDGEGFLIGADGGLVAATAKTSDYYQGDEPQFAQTITLRQGEHWMEKDIADESASAILIKIAVPVFASVVAEIQLENPPQNHPAIGVLVIGLHQSVLEISRDCEKFAFESDLAPPISN